MSIQTLSSVTIETIENYRNAANAAVKAYRVGSQRLIDAVNAGIEKSVYARTEEYAPNLTLTMNQFRGNVTEIIVKGVCGVTANTEKAITVSTTAAAERVSKVAEYAAGIDNRIVVSGLDAAVRLSMPGAKAALVVSAKVAEGADALSRAVARKPVKAAAGKAAKAVKKTAVRAQRTVARKATTVKAAVVRKAPVKRARKAAVAA